MAGNGKEDDDGDFDKGKSYLKKPKIEEMQIYIHICKCYKWSMYKEQITFGMNVRTRIFLY